MLNTFLIIVIAIISIYLIKTNNDIHQIHYQNTLLIAQYQINKRINTQLNLEINKKRGNNYIKNYAIHKLDMQLPKRVRTID